MENVIHRGYFCPSLIQDIVVGNASRGRLVEKSKRTPDYVYKFDKDNNLILIEKEYEKEYIIRKNELEIGILFCADPEIMEIDAVSVCKYKQGKIQSYTFCLYNAFENRLSELNKEEYQYSEKELKVDWFRSMKYNKIEVNEHQKYIFSIENGYLSSYIVQNFGEDNIKNTLGYNQIYTVEKKRKI